MNASKKKILIVDDHPIFRKGLAQLISDEKDMTVCGEAEDVFSATRLISSRAPDMIIADITLKDTSGLELLKYLNDHNEEIPVLVLSMHDENIYAERALRSGARGYVMKQEMTGNVVNAIRQLLGGGIYVSRNINEKLLNRICSGTSEISGMPVDLLSDRELEIFLLLGQGLTRKEIAEKLNLNVNTIGTYRERIKEKLGIRSSAELVTRAILWCRNEKGE